RPEALEPDVLLGSRQLRLRTQAESEVVLCVAEAQLFRFGRLLEPLECVLADRLQHSEAALLDAHEVLVYEGLQGIHLRAADLLSGRERPATGEHGETSEQTPLLHVEQFVAPLDRGAERALPCGRVASSAGQHGKAPTEA